MGDEIAAALGRAGMDDELARDVIERPQHRTFLACPGAGTRKSAPDFAQARARAARNIAARRSDQAA